jgi:hypothetical protein
VIPEPLLEYERRLRGAVERRQYGELPGLLADMRVIADRNRRPDVAKWMRGAISWARLMVIAQRQIWADQSDCLPRVSRYLERSMHLESSMNTPVGICVDL